jgi:NAD(P)H-hydrate epimerase
MQAVTELPILEKRDKCAHKGNFGRICIIGGQVGMAGAPALAGKAALRSGAGLVRIAIPASILPTVAGFEPCCTTIALDDEDGHVSQKALPAVLAAAEDNDIIAIGPGLGTSRAARDIAGALIEKENLRLVIDADALNCLAKDPTWVQRRKASIVLTPHPGEMKRLWESLFRDPLPEDRSEQATSLAEKTGCTVLLKGAATIVADTEKFYVNTTGNPGMATAGSGDVLTGMIAGLAAQNLDNFQAAQLAAYIHGSAGNIAAKKKGQLSMIATDIIQLLPEAFRRHNEKK